jgi:hypothetical protein
MGEAREEIRSANNILVGKREEKRLLGTVGGVEWSIILKWI